MAKYEEGHLRCVVREGYRVLLRGEVRLCFPNGCQVIRSYYERVGEICLGWAERMEGERLREQYLGLASNGERATFPMARYTLTCEPVWEVGPHVGFLCRSALSERGNARKSCLAQVWDTEEQALLPPRQVRELLAKTDGVKRRILPCGEAVSEEEILQYFGNPTFVSRFGSV